MTRRDELALSTGAYALNALSDSERAALEVLLADSEDLRTEVTGLSDTAVMLGLSSTPVAPSAELKVGLMAMLATTPQLGPVEAEAAPVLSAVPTAADQRTIDRIAAGGHHAHRASTKAEAKWFRRPTGVLLASAAAVALIVGGVGGALIGANQQSPLDQLLASSDRQITAQDASGGGTATLIWSDDLDRSAVLLDGLPELPAGQVYQFWYVTDGEAVSAGLLDSADATVKNLASDPGGDVSVAISVEPAGGSSTPTTTPIVSIEQA